MPKWTKQQIEGVKEKIKSLLVRKPTISKYEIAKTLEIDKDTALKYRKEVIQDSIDRIKSDEVEKELAIIQDEYEAIALECWRIINGEFRIIKVKEKRGRKVVEVDKKIYISPQDKMRAIRELSFARHRLFEAKLNAGVFERHLGELTVKEKHTLEDINKLPKDKQKEIYDKIIGIKRLLGRPAKPNRKK